MTDWMNDTLFYILNSRYMAKRATIITTNFQDGTPNAQDADARRREYLVERIGPRCARGSWRCAWSSRWRVPTSDRSARCRASPAALRAAR